jgi:two-component system cell cycle sensor histidine kinase/response regulator CckA
VCALYVPSSPAAGFEPMKVLYVEDDARDAELARREIARRGTGFVLDWATTLAEARKRLASDEVYDLVLTDLTLPDGHGMELVSEIRERGLHIAIVVLTGSGNEEMAVIALKTGADDYLVKRNDYLARLPMVLETALARFRAESSRRARPLRVLYAEHTATDIDLTQRHLARHAPHIRLEVVAGATEIFRKLPSAPDMECNYDVLLLDYRLTGLNALEILKALREERGLDIPVVLVTGHGDEDTAAQTLRLGASDYLVKHSGYLYELPVALEKAYDRAQLMREQTALRASEAHMRRLTERLEQYLTTSPTITYALGVKDDRIRPLWVSDNIERILGYTTEEASADDWWAANLHPEDRERALAEMAGLLSSKSPPDHLAHEYRFRCKDGRFIWAHDEMRVRRDEQDRPVEIVGAWMDITERKAAESELHLRSAALSAAANAILITDRDGAIIWANPAFTELTGYEVEESLGRNPRELIKSGKHDAAFYREMWETIAAGKVWRGEVVNRRKDASLYNERLTITPVLDARGDIHRFIAIKEDITEQKKMQDQLLRTQRLESVGRLASGIAHDLNNILAPMLLAPPLLRAALPDPSMQRLVDAIESNAQRGAEIIKQLLAFGRGTTGERIPLQLMSLVRDMERIIEETFPKNIRVRREAVASPWLVDGDPTQLHQVLLNLCVNARDAMPEGGLLTLGAANVEIDEVAAGLAPDMRPGRFVVLSVGDTGEGIPPEHMDQIFDPFFTTKEIGQGTGLGLSTVLGIVRSHGGFIQVDSRIGAGTTFRIHLPASTSLEAAASGAEREQLPQGNGEMILVVDDEVNVRQVTRQMLERNGYRVIEAKDGAEGLARYAQLRQEIHAVVTDMIMPVMDGPNFIRALRRLDPNALIIVISGFQTEESASMAIDDQAAAVINKPFSAAVLLHALRQALRRK